MRFPLILSTCFVLATPSVTKALAAVESRTGQSIYSPAPELKLSSDDKALKTLKQLESLQQELSELRGLVENYDHEIQQLKKSQKQLYLDLEKRLNALSKSSPPKEKSSPYSVPKDPVPAELEEVPLESPLEPLKASDPAPKAKMKPSAEKEHYEKAYALVKSKHYSEAILAFQHYLAQYKTGEHAASAYYWLGEVYMALWQSDQEVSLLEKASAAFLDLKTHFPEHPKSGDALLKLGVIESEKGNLEAARDYFTEVKAQHPGSAAARIAEGRLQKLS